MGDGPSGLSSLSFPNRDLKERSRKGERKVLFEDGEMFSGGGRDFVDGFWAGVALGDTASVLENSMGYEIELAETDALRVREFLGIDVSKSSGECVAAVRESQDQG